MLEGGGRERDGGNLTRVEGVHENYIAEVILWPQRSTSPFPAKTPFPRYNPNPENHEMLHAMAEAARWEGADLALGFDGNGDRCGVNDEGVETFADKIGADAGARSAALHRTRNSCST